METLTNLDWPKIIDRLSGYATSEAARVKLAELGPLSGPDQALQSFQRTDEAIPVVKAGQRPFMESLDLFSTWYSRLERNAVLKTLELKDVRHFCLEAIALSEILETHKSEWIKNTRSKIMNAAEPLSAIDQIMTPSGDIKNDASESLFQLYKEKSDQTKAVQTALDRLVKAHQMESLLQDKYVTNREGRWVLPIKSGMQHQFDGIIHASSQSKQTVFMEPQDIIPINNRLRQVDGEIEKEITRLLTDLSNYLYSVIHEFSSSREALLELDIELSKAQLAVQLKARPCEFSENKVRLDGVRHPILALQNQDVIPNTVELNDSRRVLILSGPNAGGKTVLLKSMGLAAHMARCGLLVCTDEKSQIPFFERIFISVGDSQSVDENLSTFAAHLKLLNEATQASGPKDLILIDEICGSTDPEEGAALARSFVTDYADNGAFSIITSHLGALKTDWLEESGVINGSLEFDDAKGPTYQFFMGVPGQSLAIQTAKRVGVDRKIVDRAIKMLTPEHREFHDRIEEVDQLKDELNQIKKELSRERHETETAKRKYQKLFDKFEKERNEMLDQSLKRAERKVDKMIQHAKVDDAFKRHSGLEKIKKDLPKVIKTAPSGSGATRKFETPEEFAKAYPPGSKVFIQSVGKDGVIQGKPNSKGEVPVLAGPMRLTLHWEQLKPADKATNPTQEVLRRSGLYGAAPVDTDRVVDIRGLTSEEAIDQLEVQLDTAALNQEDRVKIIHGHGTEALKRSVRSYLSRSVYVKKWQAGRKESGGDGVTWAEIKDD